MKDLRKDEGRLRAAVEAVTDAFWRAVEAAAAQPDGEVVEAAFDPFWAEAAARYKEVTWAGLPTTEDRAFRRAAGFAVEGFRRHGSIAAVRAAREGDDFSRSAREALDAWLFYSQPEAPPAEEYAPTNLAKA